MVLRRAKRQVTTEFEAGRGRRATKEPPPTPTQRGVRGGGAPRSGTSSPSRLETPLISGARRCEGGPSSTTSGDGPAFAIPAARASGSLSIRTVPSRCPSGVIRTSPDRRRCRSFLTSCGPRTVCSQGPSSSVEVSTPRVARDATRSEAPLPHPIKGGPAPAAPDGSGLRHAAPPATPAEPWQVRG
jgi:hypothetical protein